MDLGHLAGILRRRWLVAALCLLAGIIGGAFATESTTKTYRAEARLFVNIPAPQTAQEAFAGVQLSSQLLQSYARVATSRPAARDIARRVGVTPDVVSNALSADPEAETLILRIRATHSDRALARELANTAASVLVSAIADLESGKASAVQGRVIDPAEIPTRPIRPRPKLNLTLGALLGGLVGAGAAIALEQLDRTIKAAGQATVCFGTPMLGLVPRRRDASSAPLITATDPNAPATEAYRALRTAVRFVDPDEPLRTMLVTSPSADEGKTTTAANLAVALAQSGERVVIVDADLRRSRLAEYFGVESAVGLTSVVTQKVALQDALQGWHDELAILATGPLPPNPSEILGSHRMTGIIDELSAIADIVIFDAPPVLPVTDAVVLSTQVDGVLLVARAGKTERSSAAEATRRLNSVGAHVVGFVLNAVAGAAARGYYEDYRRRPPGPVSVPLRRASDLIEARSRVGRR